MNEFQAIPEFNLSVATSADGDALLQFAGEQPLVRCDLASIAALQPEVPRVLLARHGQSIVAAAIEDGLSMNVTGAPVAVGALTRQFVQVDELLVISGPAPCVTAAIEHATEPRASRLEHFMCISREDLPSSGVEMPPMRVANSDDLSLLLQARVSALHDEFGIQIIEDSTLYSELRDALTRAVEMGGVAVWIEDDHVAFTAQLGAKSDAAAMFSDLYTDPFHRGKGKATLALRAFCAWLMSESETVVMRVGVENSPAVRLYERVGFKVIEEFCASLREDAAGPTPAVNHAAE